MPYTKTSHNLPKNVKAMPSAKRAQWVDVFNDSKAKGADDATAFQAANGVAKKAKKGTKEFEQLDAILAGGKDLEGSYEDLASDIQQQLTAAEQAEGSDCYISIIGTFEGYVLVCCSHWAGGCTYWKIPYTMSGVEPVVSAEDQWTQFEMDFVPMGTGHYSDVDDAASAGVKAAASSAVRTFGDYDFGDKATTTVANGGSFVDKLRAAVSHLRGVDNNDASARSFYVTKDASGRTRFFAVHSNNFQDREKELFTAQSHKSYIKWCDDQGSYPELWVWHAKGTRFGEVDMLDYVEDGGAGVIVSSGLIDPGEEPLAEWLATKDVAMSHGFIGHRTKEGHWTEYVSWEISVLPRKAVANYGTSFNLAGLKEEDMPFTKDKRDFMLAAYGGDENAVKEKELATDAMVKQMKALGIDYKDLGVEEPAEDPAAATTKQIVSPAMAEHITAMTKATNDAIAVATSAQTALVEMQATVKTLTERAEKAEATAVGIEAAIKSGSDTVIAAKVKEAFQARSTVNVTPPSADPANLVVPAGVKEGQASEDAQWFVGALGKQLSGMNLPGTAPVAVDNPTQQFRQVPA